MIASLESCQIYDISPTISPQLAVYPGDTPFSAEFLMDMKKGDNLTLSSIHTTVHLGAHTDAPSHYSAAGETIEQRQLSRYLGQAQVVSVNPGPKQRILPEHLTTKIQAKRVLFKTGSFPNPNRWNDDFVALSPDLIDDLAKHGVVLVGIDTPSVDISDDKELLGHNAIARHDMGILEGIVLDDVTDGIYQLIALPLKIKGADAAPVRAVLLG